ncbi:MAG: TonB-dependent receptor [Bacteroidetes bacterium]|nr:TonB-dependent receptor [Bacteroidota bacterium]
MRTQILLIVCLLPVAAFLQNKDTTATIQSDSITNKIFQLGEVVVVASKNDDISERVTKENMENLNRFEVSKSLDILPGITATASGQRNESMVSVRGFDLRAVPVYMDGIPVYVPYDGYVDLARFTTFDLSAIDVSKGFSSMLYGPNSLGGAINLISRKPTKKIEFEGALGMINVNGYRGNINIGSNFGKVYFQAGYSYLHRNSYRMSSEFSPHKYENGGKRDNSYRTDQKINIKLGWTPNEKHEYVIGYINQMGKKGTPVYAGNDEKNSLYTKPRYWQWPKWNKETYYFLSNTKFNDKNYLKTRIYYDAFKNSLSSFDDSTYTTQNKPYAFQSKYNDFTYGGSIEYGTNNIPKNELKFSAHYKQDIHRENNLNEPVRRIEDYTLNFALEDIYKINKKLTLILGVGYSGRNNITAQDYDSSTKTISNFNKTKISNAFNGQIGTFYAINDNHKISGTVSRKTRFATIKDRYSYRMGSAIPNPDLKPEAAYNFDFTYTGKFFKNLNLQTSIFYNYITNAIISVSNVEPGKSQMQNAGLAEFIGIEMAVKYYIIKPLTVGANFSYIVRHNLSNPNIYFTDVPNAKVFSYLQYKPIKQINIMLSAEYNSSRYSTSYGTKSPQFTILNATTSFQVWKYIGIDAGINNIFDKNYMLTEGYPEEGRNFYITLRFFNHK